MRGVPRERRAISSAPSVSQGTLSIFAERSTMMDNSSGVYSSSRKLMPKRSRRGEVSMPARVVAPMSVNLGRSRRMERAEGPLPIMMSRAKSSMAG